MRYDFLFVCAFCLFNAITAVIQDRKIEKMQNVIDALRHEIQTTQSYMEQISEKQSEHTGN